MRARIPALVSLIHAVIADSCSISTKNVHDGGILYPRESETREVKTLDGYWNFRTSGEDQNRGYAEKWYATDLAKHGPVIHMPVPSSYNDVTTSREIRDYLGLVWYDRTFFVPHSWHEQGRRVWLRFGSVHYAAKVWINGQFLMSHEIGHLPFLQEITRYLRQPNQLNRVTVVVDNVLLPTTLPQGTITQIELINRTESRQKYTFDFFNYAGIHRSVYLYTTPQLYIDDITVKTNIAYDGTTGLVHYSIQVRGPLSKCSKITTQVKLLDREGDTVVHQTLHVCACRQGNGTMRVSNAKLWWPYLMHQNPAYLYTLQVTVCSEKCGKDIYELPVGIRELKWNSTSFTLNGEPVYFRGFDRHEDSDIRGRGFDPVTTARDYNLLRWMGANAYRTSHYPYDEKILDKADEQGILILDECPAVNVENYTDMLLRKHIQSLEELIRRDKNRPSVVMWSVANEPRSQQVGTAEYFKAVTDGVRIFDKTRPRVAALDQSYDVDLAGEFLDIIGFNRYYSWYVDPGRLEIIYDYITSEARAWHSKHNKPVIITEYGADTLAGLHKEPSVLWTEDYQTEFLSRHFRAFDTLRKENFFIGELIWNFADFNTAQAVSRADGNKKGIFTRQRQPKTSARLVRERNWLLALEYNDNVTVPKDVFPYVSTRYAAALRCTIKN